MLELLAIESWLVRILSMNVSINLVMSSFKLDIDTMRVTQKGRNTEKLARNKETNTN